MSSPATIADAKPVNEYLNQPKRCHRSSKYGKCVRCGSTFERSFSRQRICDPCRGMRDYEYEVRDANNRPTSRVFIPPVEGASAHDAVMLSAINERTAPLQELTLLAEEQWRHRLESASAVLRRYLNGDTGHVAREFCQHRQIIARKRFVLVRQTAEQREELIKYLAGCENEVVTLSNLTPKQLEDL